MKKLEYILPIAAQPWMYLNDIYLVPLHRSYNVANGILMFNKSLVKDISRSTTTQKPLSSYRPINT
jgi:hypothetical protein